MVRWNARYVFPARWQLNVTKPQAEHTKVASKHRYLSFYSRVIRISPGLPLIATGNPRDYSNLYRDDRYHYLLRLSRVSPDRGILFCLSFCKRWSWRASLCLDACYRNGIWISIGMPPNHSDEGYAAHAELATR